MYLYDLIRNKDEGRKRVSNEGDRPIGQRQLFINGILVHWKEGCVFRHLQCGFNPSLSILSSLLLFLHKQLNQILRFWPVTAVFLCEFA